VIFDSSDDDRLRFEVAYEANYKDIFAYVYRRVSQRTPDVDDIVADVFTTAWRRLDDLPAAPQDRLWLFGVARMCVLEHRRRQHHNMRLIARLDTESAHGVWSDRVGSSRFGRVHGALNGLRERDQEVLTLIYWDGLSHADAASVLDCSVNAVALRVKKAKARLHDKLMSDMSSTGRTSKTSPLPIIRKEQLP
jgi:RNA polymerase sigma-70 factor (ECF subfamily)